MKKTALITGGTGFIGKELAIELASRGYIVRILSRSKQPKEMKEYEWVQGDLSSLEAAQQAVKNCSYVFHCAGEKINPQFFTSANITATENIVTAANNEGCENFIHVSSVGVIGKTSDITIDETTPLSPQNGYEKSKKEAENIVLYSCKAKHFSIIRPTNVFNADSINKLAHYSKLQTLLKGYEHTNLVYIKDVVASMIFLLETPQKEHTFIISSDDDKNFSYLDIKNIANNTSNHFALPRFIIHLVRLLKNDHSNLANKTYSSSKLKKAGFTFPYGVQAGIDDCYKKQ